MNIGVLGGGQLGRMLASAGYPLGCDFRFLDPAAEAPVRGLAPLMRGSFEDEAALLRFASDLDVITYEFENVPARSARFLSGRVEVCPPVAALETSQDRWAEKTLFKSLGVPVAPFAKVDGPDRLDAALGEIGLPAVLKTRRLGYDGKGQRVLRSRGEAGRALRELGGSGLILEGFVRFQRELSLICARGRDGRTVFYPLVENHHEGGMLRLSLAPAPCLSRELEHKARACALRLLEALRYVGVLTVEFFQEGNELLANEMAPRVHNSGHWTIEGARTSQFENHLRALMGLSLGSTEAPGPCAMLNLIGSAPGPGRALRTPQAYLHIYGKAPRPGRKLGHVTVLAPDAKVLRRRLAGLRGELGLPDHQGSR